MGKSQASYAKKEKEKKRQQKKKDKEARKEERKANSLTGKPLEDMLAYVDENGNITDTPPDPGRKKNIKTDDIVISVRKNDDHKRDFTRTGLVTSFNAAKGYGFIRDDNSKESIFVHVNSLTFEIQENDKVSFQTSQTPKGLSAVEVKKL